MDLSELTLSEFCRGLIQKKFSAREAITVFFNKIEKEDVKIKSYLRLTKEMAWQEAEKIDAKISRKEKLPLLAGTPLAIKDNILIKGEITSAGSKILAGYRAAYDATVIKKLKVAGAIFLGQTNLDEFAMGSSTEFSAFGATTNPYDVKRVPGGSSGGSAAAVAANLALAALGSDTGGSIRQPAAFCGIVGLKPTYGTVSRFGLIALASSLDQIGPLTKNVADAALLFRILAGCDDFDSTTVQIQPSQEDYLEDLVKLKDRVKKMKVGLPVEYFAAKLDPMVAKGVETAINKLKKLGVVFKEINLPHTAYALDCYYIIMPAEASSNLARYDGIRYARLPELKSPISNLRDIYFRQRGEGFGPEVKRRILLGTFVLSYGYYDAYYLKAQQVRQLVKQDFDKAFKKVDVILTPVTPTPAFKIGEKIKSPLAMYLSDIFTIPANLAGVPALALPVKRYDLKTCAANNELPVGFQLIGQPFKEMDILALGRYYELN